jgi:hypothetical protein
MWKEGKYEDAIAIYLGKPFIATPAMELGKLYDQKWNDYIIKNNKLPEELGSCDLREPKVQTKYQVILPLSEEYEILLRGVPDLTDGDTIIDFKCGRTESNQYVGKMQLDYYSLFIPEATVGQYRCFNPYTNKLTIGIKFLNEQNREDAINEIVTYGGDILQYLLANKLFIDYKETK